MTDHEVVIELANQYLRGIYEGDTQALRAVFLPDARVEDRVTGSFRSRTADQYVAAVGSRQSPQAAGESFNMRVLSVQVLGDMANKSFAEAALIVLGALVKSSDAISASGQLDVLRYGYVLKARQKVAVRGAGPYYDGLYNVKSVTHNIKRGQYTQGFTLKRGGVFSSVPTVDL